MRALALASLMILAAAGALAVCVDHPRENCPIVINFERGPYRLTGAEAPVTFDIRASGHPLRIGWTEPGRDHAFLCLDRNGNGRIDDGGELFGNAVTLQDGSAAGNGFIALAELDSNADRIIDDRDDLWPLLLLWRDLNHDGISQPNELTPVDGSDLAAIGLDHHWTGRQDSSGNAFQYKAEVWMTSGTGHAAPRPVYDIYFVTAE
ncbi:MAG TPA: hypothetical protein VM733_10385 [Thermoanaerobaculia bacterium]|nr:hypothetical protein [Thermoanaerobaculia bacterium]